MGPVVRLGNDVELWRQRRVPNPPQFHFQPEEVDMFVGYSVEPVKCCAMLIDEAVRDPHDGDSTEAGRAGHQLPEMIVIGTFELVLDQHPVSRGGVLT